MKTLKVYGASDDLVEAGGIKGADEFNVIKDGPYMGRLLVRIPDCTDLVIHVLYDGCWSFAVTSRGWEDNDDIRDWYVLNVRRTWGEDCAYSETLEIDVPNDAVLIAELDHD